MSRLNRQEQKTLRRGSRRLRQKWRMHAEAAICELLSLLHPPHKRLPNELTPVVEVLLTGSQLALF